MGCDDKTDTDTTEPQVFQSTHPCGVRHLPSKYTAYQQSFNPRTRVGCDAILLILALNSLVSIHAPVWGATRLSSGMLAITCFNPRTRVGCDRFSRDTCGFDTSFNPRTRVGCDTSLQALWNDLPVSIHAPVWGATINKSLLKPR